MSQVIAISNQKGGVSKTTTAANLGIGLAREDKKVLLIDLDPQANLTMAFGFQQPDSLPHTVSDVLERAIQGQRINYTEGLIRHPEGIDLMPSSISLAGMETRLINEFGRENMLRQYVEEARPFYDHIIIDTSPGLNILTINAFCAADSILVPTQPQFFSAKGLEMLFDTYSKVQSKLNPDLMIEGVLITMMDRRPNFTKDVVDLIRNTYGNAVRVFDTEIPYSVRAIECGAEGKSIFQHDPGGKVAAAYETLAKEVLENAAKEKRREHYHAPAR
ncbi:ParA family protein [Christensenellaceae bacterium OttesenSCG-928-M15]|nr:ParA family protein [Christensenellaceae bacterium OttesenSCG-928-M15]